MDGMSLVCDRILEETLTIPVVVVEGVVESVWLRVWLWVCGCGGADLLRNRNRAYAAGSFTWTLKCQSKKHTDRLSLVLAHAQKREGKLVVVTGLHIATLPNVQEPSTLGMQKSPHGSKSHALRKPNKLRDTASFGSSDKRLHCN
ncbi:hypothetical protein MBM_01723 [Drepanopeziza brunnea f. sp. 'multigermtubi' MB_m1]|uniref:Uncharacterized protein n=1 Tax=Marssonina brunnea f. sp. multigermtubi (strain MB_m1) TaxID=1072389 RepID=K1X3H2_MARBU|nr:uncharacterized protein MBM_01723 [Drepanopeziza brunnea f. sp. 'multigermtubi' MB_m1]EKD19771.1 hypothetical protein MBM_01723 [Drepanopeziza brunnea f. sp. 'multigermtubi' MB_m1]